MSRFTNNLWSDLAREHGASLAHADHPQAAGSRLRRPRVFAGGTLGLAGIGAALVVALGGSAAPAYAVTQENDGSVLVNLNYTTNQNLGQVDTKLTSLGVNEHVLIYMQRGAASTSGPVTCTLGAGADTAVKILVGADGTEVIGPGQSGGNTAEGSFHLDHCVAVGNSSTDATGNTGSAPSGGAATSVVRFGGYGGKGYIVRTATTGNS
jgi:hypothetical protein